MASSQGYHVIVGGLGMLGRALQKQLLAKGKKVRVLDLAPSAQGADGRLVHPTSVDYVPCTLASESSQDILQESLREAETVYSVITADVLNGTVADMKRTNVDGTKQLLDACSSVGVPKLVHASSMAVTNQLLHHHEETEDTPLPDWDTYLIAYDRTKRQGEEMVLEKSDGGNLQTCALRYGAIMAGPGDYITRSFFDTPGRIIMPQTGKPIDHLSVHDAATALLSASEKLDSTESPVGGKAIFVTKCKKNQPTTTPELFSKFAEQLDFKLTQVPKLRSVP